MNQYFMLHFTRYVEIKNKMKLLLSIIMARFCDWIVIIHIESIVNKSHIFYSFNHILISKLIIGNVENRYLYKFRTRLIVCSFVSLTLSKPKKKAPLEKINYLGNLKIQLSKLHQKKVVSIRSKIYLLSTINGLWVTSQLHSCKSLIIKDLRGRESLLIIVKTGCRSFIEIIGLTSVGP